MSAFDKAAARLEAVVFKVEGKRALYEDGTGPREVLVIIDRDVEQQPLYDSNVAIRRHQAEFLRREVCNPKKGHTITLDGKLWVWDGLISDDGFVVRGHVNEG